MSEPRNQESGSVVCKNIKCLTEAGIPMLGINQNTWLPIKYTVDPCHITIKSSHEKYTAELHLEIRKIYI